MALIVSIGRDAPGGAAALFGIALGMMVFAVLWWRAT